MSVTEYFVQIKYDIACEKNVITCSFKLFYEQTTYVAENPKQSYTAGILPLSIHCDKTSLTSATGVLTL